MMTLDVTYSFTHFHIRIAARKVSNCIQVSAQLFSIFRLDLQVEMALHVIDGPQSLKSRI